MSPLTFLNLATNEIEAVKLKDIPYEAIEFAAGELQEMARRFRFLSKCLDPELGASRQLRSAAQMLEKRAADLYYQSCEHEFEWKIQPGTPGSPAERFHVCKVCGAENQDDF